MKKAKRKMKNEEGSERFHLGEGLVTPNIRRFIAKSNLN